MADAAASGAGYTVQFTHQGVQFGVIAFYQSPADGWFYGNGFVDTETGELSNFSDAEGSFDAAAALLAITFAKSHFPHGDSADNQLTAFEGGTADFKPLLPIFIAEGVSGQGAPVAPDYLDCDLAEGSVPYTFQTGGHSAHGGSAGNATSGDGAPTNATTDDAPQPVSPAAAPTDEGTKESPGAGILLVALAALAVAVARRRR